MTSKIPGVTIKQCRVMCDNRGRLMEIFRNDEGLPFGQVYMTTGYPGVVKGFHRHKLQDDNFVVVKGRIQLVLIHHGAVPRTETYYLGEHCPIRVHIPAGIWHGFKTVSPEEAIIVNTVSKPYNHSDPDEEHRDPHCGWYDWDKRDK